jgi:hypothetical protein
MLAGPDHQIMAAAVSVAKMVIAIRMVEEVPMGAIVIRGI